MEEKYRAERLWLKVYFNKPFTAVYEKVCKQMVIPFKLTIRLRRFGKSKFLVVLLIVNM